MAPPLGVDRNRWLDRLALLGSGGAFLLRAREPAHHPQVALGQTQRRFDPGLDDRVELLARDRITDLPQAENGPRAVVLALVRCDPLLHRAFALAVLGEHIDDAHL